MTTKGASAPPLRLSELLPEPAHLWIRYRPRRWPGPVGWWLDLATEALGREASHRNILPGTEAPIVDDVVYLPPVPPSLESERRALSERLTAVGTPVVYQLLDGVGPAPAGASPVSDVTASLVAGDLEPLAEVGGCVAWGLIPGVTDGPDLIRRGLDRLRESDAHQVVGVIPSLRRSERRALLETGVDRRDEAAAGDRFRALFHGPPPSLRAFARAVHGAGLSPFFPRPLPGGGTGVANNRRLAGALTRAAELWLELGQVESRAQAMFRAARKIDRETHDFSQLAREGNLGVVGWLDLESRRVVEELTVHGTSTLLDSLKKEYLSTATAV